MCLHICIKVKVKKNPAIYFPEGCCTLYGQNTFSTNLHYSAQLWTSEKSSPVLYVILSKLLAKKKKSFLVQPFPSKAAMTGVGVYRAPRMCTVALKGSSRHNNRPPLPWFSVQPPPTTTITTPPPTPPTAAFGAEVIEYDTGSTGKARAHLNAQNVIYLVFSSNPDGFNSQPVQAAVTMATSSRLHPPLRRLCFH